MLKLETLAVSAGTVGRLVSVTAICVPALIALAGAVPLGEAPRAGVPVE